MRLSGFGAPFSYRVLYSVNDGVLGLITKYNDYYLYVKGSYILEQSTSLEALQIYLKATQGNLRIHALRYNWYYPLYGFFVSENTVDLGRVFYSNSIFYSNPPAKPYFFVPISMKEDFAILYCDNDILVLRNCFMHGDNVYTCDDPYNTGSRLFLLGTDKGFLIARSVLTLSELAKSVDVDPSPLNVLPKDAEFNLFNKLQGSPTPLPTDSSPP